jgi:hypothetical protein
MTIYGETPYLVRGDEQSYKRLFYSRPEQALMRDVTISAGYGVLKAGTPLAQNVSASGNVYEYVPYCPTTPASGDTTQKGNAFLVADASGGSLTTVYVTMNDSYKFEVGDDIIIYDTSSKTTSAENLGAITAIDRTTYQHMAKITFTSATSSSFTVANSAAIHVECGADSTNGYSDCAGILASTVDTGTGENAKGALAPMILSSAILYEGCCEGLDTAAKSDISASSNGNLLVIK